jgi:hypothetical protein
LKVIGCVLVDRDLIITLLTAACATIGYDRAIPEHAGEWRCARMKHALLTTCVEVTADDAERVRRLNLMAVIFGFPAAALLACRTHRRKGLKSRRP